MSLRRVRTIGWHVVRSSNASSRAVHREPPSQFNAGTEVLDPFAAQHEDRFAGSIEEDRLRLPASVPTFQGGRVNPVCVVCVCVRARPRNRATARVCVRAYVLFTLSDCTRTFAAGVRWSSSAALKRWEQQTSS